MSLSIIHYLVVKLYIQWFLPYEIYAIKVQDNLFLYNVSLMKGHLLQKCP